MEQVEFIYTPSHDVRFITADNSGYTYKDNGEEVEAGMVVYEGQKISFDEFVEWAMQPNHYLLDAPDDRVVKIYGNKDEHCIVCADGFFDEHYMPWEEFEEYNNVICVGDKFILINDNGVGEHIELIALSPQFINL